MTGTGDTGWPVPRAEIAAVVLAAGSSLRMRGADKLLCPVGGIPLIRRAVLEALHSRVAEVIVTVPPDRPVREAALAGLDISLVEVADAGDGMSESLKCGIAALSPSMAGAVVLLPDMPEIQTRHINCLIENFRPGRIVQACDENGVPGNPVVLPRSMFAAIGSLSGDTGARRLIKDSTQPPIQVTMPGFVSSRDLDSPEAWSKWRNMHDFPGAGGGT